ADEMRLEQIVQNLLSNAIKFTATNGRISVELTKDKGDARLSVTDDGVGLTPEELSRVFEPFHQATRITEASAGGMGLGLPLVQQLVRLHGGSVEASSDGHGMGSCFTVVLPVCEMDHKAAENRSPRTTF